MKQAKPIIKSIEDKRLVGKCLVMSLANNRTKELWQEFMPQRGMIINKVRNDLFSLQVYPPSYFENFSPANEFQKWALVEVSDLDNIPEGMSPFILLPGLYAVFHYKGLNTDPSIFEYIFRTWLPSSGYVLDQRPHFEILGEKYKNNDPDSEEEIWIPVRKK